MEEILTRIAEALEAQNHTSQGWIGLQVVWRAESRLRSDQRWTEQTERLKVEFADIKHENAELLKRLDDAMAINARLLALHEKASDEALGATD
jgi:hypothetical protein